MNQAQDSRTVAIRRVAQYLHKRGHPRKTFFFILMITGIVGVGSSFLMLRFGLERMWIRYPIAASVAYAIFLIFIRIWSDRQVHDPGLVFEIEKMGDVFDIQKKVQASGQQKENSRSGLDALDFFDFGDLDNAPGILIALALFIVTGVILVFIGMVLSTSPDLLSEVLLDGLLVTGIWRRFNNRGGGDPLGTAFRITRWPASVVISALAVMGYLFECASPKAKSISDVIRTVFG